VILRNSDRIQREFRPALLEAGDAVADYFGTRLRAIYLTGSVANGEAVPGHSDVDWFTFLDEAPSETDLAWCTELQQRLAARYPEAKDFHTTPHPLARLEA